MKKRYLWIEDFDGGAAEKSFKDDLLHQTLLTENLVTFVKDFKTALNEINTENNLYDTILLDIDFPANEEMPSELEGYLHPKKYKRYVQKINKEDKNKAGYPLFLYLLVAKRFPLHRICFLSANIFEENESFDVVKMIDFTIDMDEAEETYEQIKEKYEEYFEIADWEEKNFQSKQEIRQYLIDDILPSIDEFEQNNPPKLTLSFQEFLSEFHTIGLTDPLYFQKNVIRQRLWDFVAQDNSYYQLRYCIVNICDNIINHINKKHIKAIGTHFINTQKNTYQKYTEEDFKQLLKSIQSRFHRFKPNKEQEEQIYFNIVSDVVSFIEILSQPKKDAVPAYPVLKLLRNMIAHGKIKKVSLQFCAFIFGIGMRFLFRIDTSDEEYQILEEQLLDCIGKEKELRADIPLKILKKRINEAYFYNEKEFSYDNDNTYSIFDTIGSKKSSSSITLQHFYQLYVLRFYQVTRIPPDNKEKLFTTDTEHENEITTYVKFKIEPPTNISEDKYLKRITSKIKI